MSLEHIAPKREEYPDTEIKNNEEEQINYYNEYCRLYFANHILATQLKELNIEKADLVTKLGKLEVTVSSRRRRQKSSRRETADRLIRKKGGFAGRLSISQGTTSVKSKDALNLTGNKRVI